LKIRGSVMSLEGSDSVSIFEGSVSKCSFTKICRSMVLFGGHVTALG